MGSKFIFEGHSFITAVSRLTFTEKSQLKEDLGSIRGQFAEYWDYNCTHLTVREMGMTMNVLYAVASNVPIVTLRYWSEAKKKIAAGEQLPDVNMYSSPPVTKTISNRVDWKKNVDRKGLFKNKMFVFITEDAKKPMERIILQLEGSCVACDKEPLVSVKKSTQQILLVQATVEKSDNRIFNEIAEFIKEKNQRAILEIEIALAILSGSCDTFSNPNFKKMNGCFRSPGIPGSIQVSNSATEDHNLQLSKKRSTDEQDQGNVLKRLKHETIPSSDTLESEGAEVCEVDSQNSIKVNPFRSLKHIKPSEGRIVNSHNDRKYVAEILGNINPLSVSNAADDEIKIPMTDEQKGGSIFIDLDGSETDRTDAPWISKKSCSIDQADFPTEVIGRYKNAVEIVPMKITLNNRHRTADSRRNFKKFKKSKPLCPQSKTVDSDRLVCVSLRRKSSIRAEETRLSQCQNEQVAVSRCEVVPAVKRGPKRFILAQELCI
nr:unnamed protein product [Callosobruchus chinensis]